MKEKSYRLIGTYKISHKEGRGHNPQTFSKCAPRDAIPAYHEILLRPTVSHYPVSQAKKRIDRILTTLKGVRQSIHQTENMILI